MICSSCGKAPAAVFIKTVLNNQVSQAALCVPCAEQAQAGWDPAQELLDLLAGMRPARTRAPAPCPGCRASWARFQETGRLGCARCYEHFGAALKSVVARIHGGARAHRGGRPRRAPSP